MRKTLCALMMIVATIFVSCGNILQTGLQYETETTGEQTSKQIVVQSNKPLSSEPTQTPESTQTSAPTETTAPSGTVAPAEFVPSGDSWGRSVFDNFLETRSKVILTSYVTGNYLVYYYSKADGEIYPFCFDPFCNHSNYNKDSKEYYPHCMSTIFAGLADFTSGYQTAPLYINSRIYFFWFNRLYSCSETASDIRLEYSFYDGKMTAPEFYKVKKKVLIDQLQNDGSQIFFKYVDENGNVIQYRYDTVSRKLYDLSSLIDAASKKIGVALYLTGFLNGKIYYEGYINVKSGESVENIDGDFEGYFMSDYELKNVERSNFEVPIAYFIKKNNGVIIQNRDKENNEISLVFYGFNGEKETIMYDKLSKLEDGYAINTLFLTDNSLYFYRNEELILREYVTSSGYASRVVNTNGGKIYRYDFESGNIYCVYNDKYDRLTGRFYVDETAKTAIFSVSRFYPDDLVKPEKNELVICDIDENGNFVNRRKADFN